MVIVAACDSELVGRKVCQGKVKLDVCEGFYGDEDFDEKALPNFLAICNTANMTGKRTVAAAIKVGYIDRECVMKIDGVPHAHLYRV